MFGRISIGLVHDLSHPDPEHRQQLQADGEDVGRPRIPRDLQAHGRARAGADQARARRPAQRGPADAARALPARRQQGAAPSSPSRCRRRPRAPASRSRPSSSSAPLYIEGDLFALNRVYRNLITNAFQATPPRGRVVVRTLRQDEQAVIEIADTGRGIPPERLDTIFDDFVTTKRRGLGLGLAISKRMVEQLGGTHRRHQRGRARQHLHAALPADEGTAAQLATVSRRVQKADPARDAAAPGTEPGAA